ncbi:biotin transporter BioY [Bifidobacterium choerinum]|uniref:biotin transporter BioY n=1 Tax=Bifidobacterium choerinum TaxID=35760 RepID=UPI003F930750
MNQQSNHGSSLSIRTSEVTIRRAVGGALPVMLTTGALCAAAAIGRIAIPGTPVPITLQTLVLMIAAVTLRWRQVAGAVALYLAMGLCGLPVFSGGMSTAALVGPTCGFLYAFLPAGIVTSLLAALVMRFASRWAPRGEAGLGGAAGRGGRIGDMCVRRADDAARFGIAHVGRAGRIGHVGRIGDAHSSAASALLSIAVFLGYFLACAIGCVLLQDGVGVLVQAATTHMPLKPLAMASAAFIPGDLVKAALAASLATPVTLAKLQ